MRAILHRYRCRLMAMLALLIGVCPTVWAQRSHFHNLNIDAGLVQSQATSMAQDAYGNLWVGTYGGVSRFDGQTFTNYTIRNGLLTNVVRAIGVDSRNHVWIGTPEGLSVYDGKTVKHYQLPEIIERGLTVTQQIQVVGDTVWWRKQGDVFYIANGKKHYLHTPAGPGGISAIMAVKGQLYVAAPGVLMRLRQAATWDTVAMVAAVAEDGSLPRFNHVFCSHNGTLWLTGATGLYKVENGLLEQVISNDGSYLAGITSIAEDKDEALWLGTNNGVVKWHAGGWQHYNKKNGLTDNEILNLVCDNEGNIWMATDGQGLYRYSGTQFSGLDEVSGLASAQVMAIARSRTDSLFVGTYDAGLYVLAQGKVSPLSFPSNPVPAITSLCYTQEGILWIGTRGRGLWSYDNGIFRQYAAPERDFPSNSVHSLYIDTFSRLWVGFANGIMVLEDNMFKPVATNTRPVYSFVSIGYDSTLISTEGSLMMFHAGELKEFRTNSIIDSYAIQCFLMRDGKLWMGSNDNGLMGYDMRTGAVVVINKSNGLQSDFIYNITTDVAGNIWVGTGFGIHKIVLKEGEEPKVTFYGKEQGITGMESNINAVMRMSDGSIWFGTNNGAVRYDPNTSVVNPTPSRIVLQAVRVAGEPQLDKQWYDATDTWYGVPQNLRLPYKKNSLSFTFQAITMAGAKQIMYRYRMDGLDAPWSDWSAANTITYSALPPGKYVLHVQCKGNMGVAPTELIYEFEIITPFFKTTWFRFAIFVFCILIGVVFQYSITKRKQRREALLAKLRAEELGKIRARTAEDFHDEIGNKLTRINVLTNVLRNKIELTPETTRILGQIEDNTAQLYGGTKDILWSLKPSNDVLSEILYRIRDFGMELFQDTEINFVFTGVDDKWRAYRLDMNMSRNLIMIFKEALNNTLKYAKAKNVTLEVVLKNKDVLHMVLKDDGVGFDMQKAHKGNGMANMQTRAGRLNGKLYIDSRAGKGTIITLSFKIPPKR